MQLREQLVAVARGDVRDAVVAADADARLHELQRVVFPDEAVALLLVLGAVSVGLEVLVADLEVVPLA